MSASNASLQIVGFFIFMFVLFCFVLPFGMHCNFFLIADYAVLDKRHCCKQTFSKVVVRYRRIGRLPQSFGELMPLGL